MSYNKDRSASILSKNVHVVSSFAVVPNIPDYREFARAAPHHEFVLRPLVSLKVRPRKRATAMKPPQRVTAWARSERPARTK